MLTNITYLLIEKIINKKNELLTKCRMIGYNFIM